VGIRGAAPFAVLVGGVLVGRGVGPRSFGFEAELRWWDGMVVAVVGGRMTRHRIVVRRHCRSHHCVIG